jgi:2-dehydro-3-deoxy-L-rhamnonate dehydrogenase (NAD+)
MPPSGETAQSPARDRVAFITGAGSGIGLASAHRLAAEGFRLFLTDLNAAAAERAAGEVAADDEAVNWRLDVTDPGACAEAVSAALDRWGRLDAVVHSAGITHRVAPTWELTPAEWRQVIDVNLNGVYNVMRAVIPSMVAAGCGRIVMLASIAGKEGNANNAAYSAAKAGVIGLVKALGKELARSGVIVNAIAPAMIDTPILSSVEQWQLADMAQRIPMGRIGRAEEVAALAAWLVSCDCTFSTGAVYDISGGRATYL